MFTPHLADFMQRTVTQDHHRLLERMESLRQCLLAEPLGGDWLRELWHLEEELEAHFAHEELGGFFTEVIESAPERGRIVAELQRQHDVMRRQVRLLRDQFHAAEKDVSLQAAAWRSFTEFESLFTQHEQAEHQLLQTAWNDDIGCCD